MIKAALLLILSITQASAMEIRKEELFGAWRYVESYNRMPDGSRLELFGNAPNGQFILMPHGVYGHILFHRQCKDPVNLVQCTTNGRQLNHFGTFTINERDGFFVGRVFSSSDRRLINRDQVRTVLKLDRNSLVYINSLSIAGGDARVYATLTRQ